MEFKVTDEFEENIREAWNALLEKSVSNVPFLRFEMLETWWQNRGGGEWPEDAQLAIITGWEAGTLVGIAPCFVTEHDGVRALMLLGSIEICDYLDLIVRPEDEARFICELLDFIKGNFAGELGIQHLDFYNFQDGSPTLGLLAEASSARGWKFEQTTLQHSPFIQLPGDWETYLASIDKKQRHEIRRKMRRAEESDFPVGWYITSSVEQLEEDSEDFFRLMVQESDKAEFLTPAMRKQMKASMFTAFNAGILQLAFLTVNGSKAAAYYNFDYQNCIWVYNSGIDRDFSDYSPGWVLLGHLLRWSNENKRSEFDFMRGDEDYKYRFGAVDRFVVRVKIQIL